MRYAPLFFASLLAAPGVCYAQSADPLPAPPAAETETNSPLSGSLAIRNNYVLIDGFELNDEPIVEAFVSLDLGDGFSANAFVARGLTQDDGNEVDLGLAYTREIAENTELNVSASYYFLQGDDMLAFTASVTHGRAKLETTYYAYLGGNADALQVAGSYTLPVASNVDVRGLAVYETGFDLADIALVGAEAEVRLNDRISLDFRLLQPVMREAGDPRDRRITVGIRFNF